MMRPIGDAAPNSARAVDSLTIAVRTPWGTSSRRNPTPATIGMWKVEKKLSLTSGLLRFDLALRVRRSDPDEARTRRNRQRLC